MHKLLLVFFFATFSFSLLGKEICLKGFTGSWSFDQKKKLIVLESKKNSEVCQISQVELNSNFELRFFKKNKMIYSKKIFWAQETFHDLQEGEELKAVVTKNTDYKIIKIPVTLNMIDRYQVVNLSTGEVWGKGFIK